MSSTLISRSHDLRRLRDRGYNLSILGGYLLMTEVPYVTPAGEVDTGTLVSDLTLAGDITTTPGDHVARFVGQMPCHPDGRPLTELVIDTTPLQVGPSLTTTHTFSHKPPDGYPDYYAKMSSYADILTGFARVLDPDATAQNFTPVAQDDPNSPFRYLDTAASRAGTVSVNQTLALPKVAIIGLGGTGSYLLDFLAKTPIQELHLFDGDIFLQHNAFRSPGAATLEELGAQIAKVDYHAGRYAPLRDGIIAHHAPVNSTTSTSLADMAFVFICIDDGPSKEVIVSYCESSGIPFVDAGMGIDVIDGALSGIVRTTVGRPEPGSQTAARSCISFGRAGDDAYHHGVQVAELNALNAAFAVIAFKKSVGFYADLTPIDSTTYTLATNEVDNIGTDYD